MGRHRLGRGQHPCPGRQRDAPFPHRVLACLVRQGGRLGQTRFLALGSDGRTRGGRHERGGRARPAQSQRPDGLPAHYGRRDPTRRQPAERAQVEGITLSPVVEVEQVDSALHLVSGAPGTPSFPGPSRAAARSRETCTPSVSPSRCTTPSPWSVVRGPYCHRPPGSSPGRPAACCSNTEQLTGHRPGNCPCPWGRRRAVSGVCVDAPSLPPVRPVCAAAPETGARPQCGQWQVPAPTTRGVTVPPGSRTPGRAPEVVTAARRPEPCDPRSGHRGPGIASSPPSWERLPLAPTKGEDRPARGHLRKWGADRAPASARQPSPDRAAYAASASSSRATPSRAVRYCSISRSAVRSASSAVREAVMTHRV